MGLSWKQKSFGAEMKLPKLTQNQMDLLRYSKWFLTYSAFATGKNMGAYHPEDWNKGGAIGCYKVTSDGWGNDKIARRTLKSLLEKKVLYATKTNYFDYDGRIRKSPAQQVNENPDLVSELTSVCLGLTPIGVEIIKREFARRVRDVVGWRIELTLEDGQTAYLSDMPDDVAQSIDDHIEDVRWDIRGEQFGAEYQPTEGYEDCEVCYATVKEGTLHDVQAGRICDECHSKNKYAYGTGRQNNPPFNAESFGAEVLSIVNPSGRSENDDPRKLYVSIGFRDGEIYRGYVELDSEYEMDEEGYQRKKAESFGAEFAGYEDPISERQRYRIRKLGGRIDKAMTRSEASKYIKSLMAMPLHAESTDCSVCEGWGWNEELDMVCDADGCIGGWVVPKKPSLLERGLELGAGMGMGMAGVAILFGLVGGTVGFAAETRKKRRD